MLSVDSVTFPFVGCQPVTAVIVCCAKADSWSLALLTASCGEMQQRTSRLRRLKASVAILSTAHVYSTNSRESGRLRDKVKCRMHNMHNQGQADVVTTLISGTNIAARPRQARKLMLVVGSCQWILICSCPQAVEIKLWQW